MTKYEIAQDVVNYSPSLTELVEELASNFQHKEDSFVRVDTSTYAYLLNEDGLICFRTSEGRIG